MSGCSLCAERVCTVTCVHVAIRVCTIVNVCACTMMIVLLLFLQKQNLANAIYLFGLGTLLSGLGLKHMRIRSHHDLAGTLVTPYS